MTNQQTILDWLTNLMRLTRRSADKPHEPDTIALYAGMLEHDFDQAAFTPASLNAVARELTWWPAYAELVDVLGKWWRTNRPLLPAIAPPQAMSEPEREVLCDQELLAMYDRLSRPEGAFMAGYFSTQAARLRQKLTQT